MSRAFTREDESDNAIADIGERPVSQHRNLVTEAGLSLIDDEVGRLRADLARAEAEGNREKIALMSRDLRYWNARRETAELSVPDRDSTVVRFGMTVRIENEDGKQQNWTIVGEDEADASQGRISHVSPMALALFGKAVGEVATVNGKAWEIVSLGVDQTANS
jgi:transcription elongation GreA/GreB family factor